MKHLILLAMVLVHVVTHAQPCIKGVVQVYTSYNQDKIPFYKDSGLALDLFTNFKPITTCYVN